jgi:hypothetical protein
MTTQRGQRIIELEAQLAGLKHNQLRVISELERKNLGLCEEALLKDQLELLSKLVPIFMLLDRYKRAERKEKLRRISCRQHRRQNKLQKYFSLKS